MHNLAMQEKGKSLFLQSFSADADLAEVLDEILELSRLVKQSKRSLDSLCEEQKIWLDESSKTFKPVGGLQADQPSLTGLSANFRKSWF